MRINVYRVLAFIVVLSLLVAAGGCPFIEDAVPAPVTGGNALDLYGTDPHRLDPALSGEATSHQYILQLFGGLVRLDDKLEVVADIARDWEVSDDGTTYTFYLRQDVSFHDGRGVEAGDFKYSWQRACDPATGSLTAATYLGDIVGAGDVLAGDSVEISGIEVINDYTLQVTIDAPKSYFLSKLTYPTAFVVDRANVERGGEWWRRPNGTGPFRLKQWNEGSLFVLERNEHYYGQRAAVETVVFHLFGGVPMNLYEDGEIDIAGVSYSYIDKVTDKAGPFYRDLVVFPELSFSYIGFNTSRPPFDDVNIRRAFTQAVDKEKLVSLIFRDMMQPAYGILPPGIPGFDEELAGLDFDVARAKELIGQSRYGDVSKLPPITITTSGYGGLISQSLEAIVHQWRQNLGVEVTVRQLEPEMYFYSLREEKDEMYEIGWIADYPHPQDFLDILFRSGAENNYGEYSNPEVDALIEMANLEQDGERSLALYRQAERKLVEDAACLPLFFGRNYILVKPYVKGYSLNPMGYAMLNRVSLD